MVMSRRSFNLGRLRPRKRLTSTSCTYFRRKLPLLNQRKEKQILATRADPLCGETFFRLNYGQISFGLLDYNRRRMEGKRYIV